MALNVHDAYSGVVPYTGPPPPAGQASGPGGPAATWWAVKASNGSVGVVQQGSNPAKKLESWLAKLLGIKGASGVQIAYKLGPGPAAAVGSGTQPPANVNGHALSDILTALGANSAQVTTATQSIDVGSLQRGNSATFDTAGKESTYDPHGTSSGSSAVASNIIPSPSLPSIASIVGVLGDLSFWKGIGLVLAGVLILIFAGLELKKI